MLLLIYIVEYYPTRIPEGDAIASRLEENPDEVERLLNELLISKKIRIKEDENELIV
ncbi:hypothetical protein [Cetobacterium sp.]|uniref:hypothetical protein n=1 Tax=Cetobacterium sp. TaxID=2071632 RepID=UPI003EE7F95E